MAFEFRAAEFPHETTHEAQGPFEFRASARKKGARARNCPPHGDDHSSEMKHPRRPDWNSLGEFTLFQKGWFTNKQAAEAGISAQVLHHNVKTGRIVRMRRGIYRMAYSPMLPEERYVEVALWACGEGVFSHTTALLMLGLVDPPPPSLRAPPLQLTVPYHWRGRRFRHPPHVELRFGHVPRREQLSYAWQVRVTGYLRTLHDCAADGVHFELLRQAARRACTKHPLSEADIDLALGFRAGW